MSSVYRSFDKDLFLSADDSTVFGVIHRGQCAYLCHKEFFGVTVEQIFQCLIETKNDIQHSAEIRMKLCNLERFLAQRKEGDDSLTCAMKWLKLLRESNVSVLSTFWSVMKKVTSATKQWTCIRRKMQLLDIFYQY